MAMAAVDTLKVYILKLRIMLESLSHNSTNGFAFRLPCPMIDIRADSDEYPVSGNHVRKVHSNSTSGAAVSISAEKGTVNNLATWVK